MRALTAEVSKLASLPAVWVAGVLAVLLPSVIAGINSSSAHGVIDTGYQELAFGVVGVIVLGVVGVSSEYVTESAESGGGRQITTSLSAVPSRLRFLFAKMSAVAIVGALLAGVAGAVTMGVVQIGLGELAPVLGLDDVVRLGGVVCYWVYTALLAAGVTLLTRHGVVPLAVLIVNTSVVSVTYLLTKVTPLANYLPDMAGIRMFIRDLADSTTEISPLVGGLVMTAWVGVVLGIAAIVFTRREA
jgi:ABC-2 type transport system permease protein